MVPLAAVRDVPLSQDAVAITFDDGFDNLREALPALEGLPATIFVVSEHVGRHNDWGGRAEPGIPHLPLMTWDDLASVGSGHVALGAHTRFHPHLTRVDDPRLVDELEEGASTIARRTGTRPSAFAYPYGDCDARVVDVVRRRFDLACTTTLRALGSAEDPALLPRLDMFYLREAGALEQWGSSGFRARLWVRAMGRKARTLMPTRLVA